MMEEAIPIIEKAERIIVVGTSMQVYPAASLLDFAPDGVPIHLVDPHPPQVNIPNLEIIAKGAVEGLSELLARFTLEV
jgi:NAD-dependent deacetylase